MQTTTITSLLLAIIVFHTALSGTTVRAASDEPTKYEIQVETVEEQPAMSIRFRAAPKEVGEKFGQSMGALYGYVMSKGGKVVGPPFGRYHEVSDDELEIEAGVPVEKVLKGNDSIKPSKLPGGEVASTLHKGSYDSLRDVHDALRKWAEANKKPSDGTIWEAYLSPPKSPSDHTGAETKLFLPLEKAEF